MAIWTAVGEVGEAEVAGVEAVVEDKAAEDGTGEFKMDGNEGAEYETAEDKVAEDGKSEAKVAEDEVTE